MIMTNCPFSLMIEHGGARLKLEYLQAASRVKQAMFFTFIIKLPFKMDNSYFKFLGKDLLQDK